MVFVMGSDYNRGVPFYHYTWNGWLHSARSSHEASCVASPPFWHEEFIQDGAGWQLHDPGAW
jgi:hypothetical protein